LFWRHLSDSQVRCSAVWDAHIVEAKA